MSWITTPMETTWPEELPSGRRPVLMAEAEGVQDRRKGTAHAWEEQDRAALLALPGAVEHGSRLSTVTPEWRPPEPPA